jgi:hypothetical protein
MREDSEQTPTKKTEEERERERRRDRAERRARFFTCDPDNPLILRSID